jgi:hypothetical protein
VRLEPHRLRQIGDRVVVIVAAVIGHAAVQIRAGKTRLQLQRGVEILEGVFVVVGAGVA